MKYEVIINNETRTIEFKTKEDARVLALVSGIPLECEVYQPQPDTYLILAGQKVYEFKVSTSADGEFVLHSAGATINARVSDPKHKRRAAGASQEGRQQIVAPMPGKIVKVLVSIGEQVEPGQGIVVIEAMKMQNELKSPKIGSVVTINAIEGQTVASAEVLAIIE